MKKSYVFLHLIYTVASPVHALCNQYFFKALACAKKPNKDINCDDIELCKEKFEQSIKKANKKRNANKIENINKSLEKIEDSPLNAYCQNPSPKKKHKIFKEGRKYASNKKDKAVFLPDIIKLRAEATDSHHSHYLESLAKYFSDIKLLKKEIFNNLSDASISKNNPKGRVSYFFESPAKVAQVLDETSKIQSKDVTLDNDGKPINKINICTKNHSNIGFSLEKQNPLQTSQLSSKDINFYVTPCANIIYKEKLIKGVKEDMVYTIYPNDEDEKLIPYKEWLTLLEKAIEEYNV